MDFFLFKCVYKIKRKKKQNIKHQHILIRYRDMINIQKFDYLQKEKFYKVIYLRNSDTGPDGKITIE